MFIQMGDHLFRISDVSRVERTCADYRTERCRIVLKDGTALPVSNTLPEILVVLNGEDSV